MGTVISAEKFLTGNGKGLASQAPVPYTGFVNQVKRSSGRGAIPHRQ